ncbi:MAG: GntR family transcriptional regulator [Pelagimonas sp.]|uniref:GntR family transcriptional regulator n=1 Tax=Pelagimonas sp. TaxID=2073170 RepID=UPI003D6BFCE5
MKQADIKPQSNTQRAIQALRDMIFAGDLPAGSDHLESELAVQLGMSRTPIREAALTLEGQGLLEMRPRKGVRILPVSPSDMREIYDVLTELESLAARQAAQRHPSATDMAALAQAMTDMDTALAANNLEDWAEADDRFHKELVGLGGNGRVRMVVNMLSDQVRRARMITLHMRPVPLQSNEDHRAVFDAIKSGDADKAHAIHRAHRQAAKDLIVALLEKHKLNRV